MDQASVVEESQQDKTRDSMYKLYQNAGRQILSVFTFSISPGSNLVYIIKFIKKNYSLEQRDKNKKNHYTESSQTALKIIIIK